jgi:tRNA G18 (ribose-2'-O)-methylase SpoU
MFRLRHIETFDEPGLAPYRTMRRPKEHATQGIFVAEGDKVVQRLLQDPRYGIVSVVLPPDRVEEFTPLLQARPEDFDLFIAEKKLLNTLIGFHMYQGVLAVGRIPAQPSLEDVLANAPRPLLLVAADDLTNSENVGSLVRNCAAFGVHGLLVGETCASPWLRRAVRNSMGTLFQLPTVETASLVLTLRQLRDQGIHIVAAHPHSDQRTLTQGKFTGDCCIVMGSEGTGIRPEVLEVCDEAVAIPMPPTVDSLNVTSATSVFLYEANRQRGMM